MKTNRKSGRDGILPLLLAAVLLFLPAGALFMNVTAASVVYAGEDGPGAGDAADVSGNGADETDPGAAQDLEDDTEAGDEDEDEDWDEECICDDKCSKYEFNRKCPSCSEDYRECGYVPPVVGITITAPSGWHGSTAKVAVGVRDLAESGNFEAAKVEARIGQNGTWTDISDDMHIEIAENCVVYVRVTDQKGRTYEKNRAMKCFDFTKPTLNAAISDGILTVQASDVESGVSCVFVNGYKFTDIDNGLLSIRLEKFDAGYEYFLIYAQDNAGNTSENYRTKNPYYKDPADDSDENPAAQLPTSASPTEPGSATALVTEHTVTDAKGNTTSQTSKEEQKKRAMREADEAERSETSGYPSTSANGAARTSERGKEFYTIRTASDKIFYLIIDRDGEDETVYFLTEITENDLLNTTSGNSETLPKNSAALDNGIPVTENALPNNNTEKPAKEETGKPGKKVVEEDKGDEISGNAAAEKPVKEKEPQEKEPAKENTMAGYVVMGVLAAIGIVGGYYFKVVRKKKEGFLDEEDDEDGAEEFIRDDTGDEDAAETDGFFPPDEKDVTETIDDEE